MRVTQKGMNVQIKIVFLLLDLSLLLGIRRTTDQSDDREILTIPYKSPCNLRYGLLVREFLCVKSPRNSKGHSLYVDFDLTLR